MKLLPIHIQTENGWRSRVESLVWKLSQPLLKMEKHCWTSLRRTAEKIGSILWGQTSARKNRHADTVSYSWQVIYGQTMSGAAGGLSILRQKEWAQTDCYTLHTCTLSYIGSLQNLIRQKICIEQKQSLLGLTEAAAALDTRLNRILSIWTVCNCKSCKL